jgi:ribosomal protein S18 acetylase RimI-like enzyme
MNKIKIDYDFPSDRELKKFILSTELYIPRPLTQRVNLNSFLNKLKCKANIVCAWKNKKLGGVSLFYLKETENPVAFITYIAVIPEFWGEGLAGKLLNQTKQLAKNFNKKQVKLEVDKDNKRAIAFYKKQGFQIEKHMGSSFFMKINL